MLKLSIAMGTSVGAFLEKKIKKAFGLDWFDTFEAEQKAELAKAYDEANENPDDLNKLRWAAFQAYIQGEYDGAQEWIEKGIALGDEVNSFRSLRVLVLIRQSRFQEAMDECDSLEREDGPARFLYQNRAEALHKLGRFDEALESVQRAEAYPGDAAGLNTTRAEILQSMGRFTEAAQALKTARETGVEPKFSAIITESHEKSNWRNRFGLLELESLDDEAHAEVADLIGRAGVLDRGLTFILLNQKKIRKATLTGCVVLLLALPLAFPFSAYLDKKLNFIFWPVLLAATTVVGLTIMLRSIVMLRLWTKRSLPDAESRIFQAASVMIGVSWMVAMLSPLFAIAHSRFGAYALCNLVGAMVAFFIVEEDAVFRRARSKALGYVGVGITGGMLVVTSYFAIRLALRILQIGQLV